MLAGRALDLIASIYDPEQVIREQGMSDEKKQLYRAQHCKAVVDEFFSWLKVTMHEYLLLPSSPFTRAGNYALDREDALRVFLEYPNVPVDTNHLEREIRPIAVGRKNWLFCCVPQRHRGLNRNGLLRLCKAVEKMTVGPSKSAVRSRLQTTPSGWH